MSDDDLVPVSVRLGAVVPPEDPEDWTRPLTWVAALGMLAGPILALAHAFVASAAGLAGAAVGAVVAAVAARLRSRVVRFVPAVLAGVATAAGVVGVMLPA